MEAFFNTLLHIGAIILIPYIGYLHRSLSNMKCLIDTKLTRAEVSELIDLKKEVTDFQYKSLKEDMEELKTKLDKLIESLQH